MKKRMEQLGLPPGYRLAAPLRSGHRPVLKPDGTVLRGANGVPIHVADSPAGVNAARDRERARIRKAIRAAEQAR